MASYSIDVCKKLLGNTVWRVSFRRCCSGVRRNVQMRSHRPVWSRLANVLVPAVVLSWVLVFTSTTRAEQVAVDILDSTNSFFSFLGEGTLGWAFQPNDDITLRQLGMFDRDMDGLSEAHEIGIWDDTETLIASATIPSGTAGTLIGEFRFIGVPDLLLQSGTTYTIAATTNNNEIWAANDTVVDVDPSITIMEARSFVQCAGCGDVLTYPTSRQVLNQDLASFGMFGPTFTFDLASVVVLPGEDNNGSLGGGSEATGGIDFLFDEVTDSGTLTVDYETPATQVELEDLFPEGTAPLVNFGVVSDPYQFWNIDFDGTFEGVAALTFAYDDTILIWPEEDLVLYHFVDDNWVVETDGFILDTVANTITINVDSFSPFVLGVVPEPSSLALIAVGLLGLGNRRRKQA